MSGGAYVALSGMRARAAQLDRVAADIANVGTSGYKAERNSSIAAERPFFESALDAAVDVVNGPGRVDFKPGTLVTTGRDLDCAIDGRGFFVIQTPAGPRYTRNGQFSRAPGGELAASDGSFVLGQDNERISIGDGRVEFDPDGSVRVNGAVAGRLRLVDFADTAVLAREQGERFAGPPLTEAREAAGVVRSNAIEGSNVSLMERVAQLTQLTHTFEALNRGISVLLNELDGRVISELGRR
ncbi:MAG TPA: flagellar hook basal-body protein [Vicinamibacterales bacterium]|nr:flagellar hook basal-body protein [Vicinamibacterales bacterium]